MTTTRTEEPERHGGVIVVVTLGAVVMGLLILIAIVNAKG